MHNYTDHQRRSMELQAIYDYHSMMIRQFVHDFNNNNEEKKKKNNNNNILLLLRELELYEVNMDDATNAPLELARALGFLSKDKEDQQQQKIKEQIQQCWTYATTMKQFA